MEIDDLHLFVRAAEKLNISAAGRELGFAPAVASARLARLERELSAELLHRSTRKVAVSLEGQEFLPFAREILSQRDAAMAALGKGKSRVEGTIRFAASSSFAQLFIAPLLPEFLSINPGIKLDLRFSDSPFDLLEGSFDLALRNAALEDSSLKARKLVNVDEILCASPDYLAEYGTPGSPEDLNQHHLIAFRQINGAILLRKGTQRHALQLDGENCRASFDDGASQRIATEAGLGISLNAEWNVQEQIASGALVRILPEFDFVSDRAVWLVYPRSNVLTAKVRLLIDFLVEKVG